MLSIVLPVKNEQGNLAPLIEEISVALAAHEFEVVVVDDGSTDHSVSEALDAAQRYQVKLQLLQHQHSCGQSKALHTGISYACGQWIVTLDADGQNDPADIPALLSLAKTMIPPYFCIAGYRKHRQDTVWKRWQSKFANHIRQRLLGDGVPDTGCGLKLFPRQLFLDLPYFDHMHRYLPALTQRLGGQVQICEVNHRPRLSGCSNYGALDRALVGIIDLLGVMWLQKRSQLTEIRVIQAKHRSHQQAS